MKRFELPFPVQHYDRTMRRARQAMQQAGIDVLIVTNPLDFYWLTGSRMTAGWAIVWDGDPIGIVRHLNASTHRLSGILKNFVECPDGGSMNEIGNVYDFVGYTAEKLIELKLNRKIIGMNFRTTRYLHVNRFKKLLPDAEIVDFRLDRIRIIKTKDEQECQFRAAKANQDALMDTINEIEVGWSERDVVNCIARHHRKHLGNDYERSVLAHCHVGENLEYMHLSNLWSPERETKKVKKGDLIYLEPGTFYKRYAGTMLRTFSVGEPSPKAKRSILACIEVLNRTIEAYAPGKTGHEIDKIGRDYFVKMGLECRSRIGYCNGIDWSGGDVMSIIPNNPLILVPGHIFHCIALTYLPGFGYMGMSEQLLVTEDGHEVLGDRNRTCERKLLVI